MSLFKRLSISLGSRVDQVVSDLENHAAVAETSIHAMRKKIAEAKVRLNHVQRETSRVEQQITQQQDNIERWQQRAITSADKDEEKALHCVKRSQQCQEQVQRLQQVLQQYQQTGTQLAQQIENSETKLQVQQQKLTLMQARQSTAAALNASKICDETCEPYLDETFDRWEVKLSASEMASNYDDFSDPIEHEFLTQEQTESLRMELSRLQDQEKD